MRIFQTALTEMFEKVEPAFRAATIAHYRNIAQTTFDSWVKVMSGRRPPDNRFAYEMSRPPQYTKIKDGSYSPNWDAIVRDIAAGKFAVDLERAEADANLSVDQAKLHFISKQAKKLENATKLRNSKPTLDGSLHFNGIVVTGQMTVEYKNGDRFRLEMSMITNHRYERGYTRFHQYPARFKDIVLGGQEIKGRVSEKWLSENFK